MVNKEHKMLEIKSLSKRFGNLQAVDNLSFTVKEGELFAFLGLNGAGKSTTISIICGNLSKDNGSVIVNGKDIDNDIFSVKSTLGVVFQNSVLDKQLTALDNLKCRAALYGINGDAFNKRLEELSKLLNLKELFNRPIEKLSGGQRRRVDIARALIHNPKILILDEPTTGLDPQTRKLLWAVVETLRKDMGVTVFLTTHYMEEAEGADYVVILDSGKIVAEGTPLELKNQYTGDFLIVYGVTEQQIKKLCMPYELQHGAYRVYVPNTKTATELIMANPDLFVDYELIKGRMDDVFLAVTGKKLVGGEENE